MMLIVGGMFQGKLDYTLSTTGLSLLDVAEDFEGAKTKPIFYRLHEAVRLAMLRYEDPAALMREAMDANPSLIVISDEVGCGVVPIDRFERDWRDQVGRICCEVAKRSTRVERIVCGLPQLLKGEALELILVRHGETPGNRLRQYVGSGSDQPLTEEARALAARIKGRYPRVERVFASPMRRAQETASLLYPEHIAETVFDFRETHFGNFEGKTYEQLKDDPIYRRYLDGDLNLKCPGEGGESRSEFAERCRRAFSGLADRLFAERVRSVAIVAHGGTIMALMSAYGLPKRSFHEWMPENLGGYRVTVTHEPLTLHLVETYSAKNDAGCPSRAE